MLERKLEKLLCDSVNATGGFTRKVSFFGHRGAPDRVVFYPNRIVWVELKAPGKVPTKLQTLEHLALRTVGQTVLVLDSIESIQQFIKEITDETRVSEKDRGFYSFPEEVCGVCGYGVGEDSLDAMGN